MKIMFSLNSCGLVQTHGTVIGSICSQKSYDFLIILIRLNILIQYYVCIIIFT